MGKRKQPKLRKATNLPVTAPYLEQRTQGLAGAGFEKPKWISFCEKLLSRGFHVSLYEARRTCSKYITVSRPGVDVRSFKVRFSNHKPIRARELANDCDFFVGVTNLQITNSEQALGATVAHFLLPATQCRQISITEKGAI